jgi:hypothetical protein
MRLWSIHPCYLDAKGLVALWREGLLAQNVLRGNTKGYKNHPQLNRFKATDNPVAAISSYLEYVVREADRRNYNFNREKLAEKKIGSKISVTEGQLEYEFKHLLIKLKVRDPGLYRESKAIKIIKPHPLFRKVTGDVEEWEVTHQT